MDGTGDQSVSKETVHAMASCLQYDFGDPPTTALTKRFNRPANYRGIWVRSCYHIPATISLEGHV